MAQENYLEVINIINTIWDIFGQANQNKSIYNEVHLTNIFCFFMGNEKTIQI